jgi:hypothetical protein
VGTGLGKSHTREGGFGRARADRSLGYERLRPVRGKSSHKTGPWRRSPPTSAP